MGQSKDRIKGLIRADKWIAAEATRQGKPRIAERAQKRADQGVKSLTRKG